MFFGVISARRPLDLHAAPAVAQRDRDRALGGVLADDVLVEFLDDLARGHLRVVDHPGSPQLLDREVAVRVDADVARRCPAPARRSRARRARCSRAARAPRPARTAPPEPIAIRLVLGLDHVAVAGDDQRRLRVGDAQQRLEAAQAAVGAPVLGELDRGAREVAVLLELALEALEQRERVGGAAGEAGRARGRRAGAAPCGRCPSSRCCRA
jgi:hypothetical protein